MKNELDAPPGNIDCRENGHYFFAISFTIPNHVILLILQRFKKLGLILYCV